MKQLLATAAVSIGAWLAWLGYHRLKAVDPVTGNESGPYEPWQVAGLVLTLAACLVVVARTGHPFLAATGSVAGLLAVAAADWSTTPTEDANLWLVSVLAMAVVAVPASIVVTLAATRIPKRGRPRTPVS